MKIKEIISGTFMKAAAAAGAIGLILTLVAIFIPGSFAKAAMVFLAGAGAAGAVFFLKTKATDEIVPPLEKLKDNTGKMAGDLSAAPEEIENAPEEVQEIQDNLRSISKDLKIKVDRTEKEKKVHKSDLNNIEEILVMASEAKSLDHKEYSIVKKLLQTCGFTNYYLFARDPDKNVLYRKNPVADEPGNYSEINLSDSNENELIKIIKRGVPAILNKISSNENYNKFFRDWCNKNHLEMLYAIPINTGNTTQALLFLSMPGPLELSRSQNLLIRLSTDLLRRFYKEEFQVLASVDRFDALEAENQVYVDLFDVKNFDETCAHFLSAISDFIPMTWGNISVFNEDGETCSMYNMDVTLGMERIRKSVMPFKRSGTEWVMNHASPRIDKNVSADKPFYEDEIFTESEIRSRIIVPFYYQKTFKGALYIASTKEDLYNDDHLSTSERLARVIGAVIERARTFSKQSQELEELKTSTRALEKYFKNLGHELKNPLEVLTSLSKNLVLTENSYEPAVMRRNIAKIKKKVDTLEDSIKELMDLSQIETGTLELKTEEFFLIEILKDVLWEFRDEAKTKLISLKLDIPRGMPEISGDPQRLKKVFRAIILGTLKHTSISGQITIKANVIPGSWLVEKGSTFFPDDIAGTMDKGIDQVLISISDNGNPLSADKQEQLFFSPRELNEIPGILEEEIESNLYQARKIIERHRGHLWFDSRVKSGNRVSFNLPQYGKGWTVLRSIINDSYEKAKKDLASLTVIIIRINNASELLKKYHSTGFADIVKEVEKAVRSTIRLREDIVRRFYDNETIIVISRSDSENSLVISERIRQRICRAKTGSLPEIPKLTYDSVTYPEEVLTSEELIAKIDKKIADSRK